MYNNKGNLIIPVEYENIGPISSNRCLVVRNEKYGYFNRNGSEKILIQYDFTYDVMAWGKFENDVVKIKKHKLAGMVDTIGQKLLPAIFEDVMPVYSDLIPVKKRGKWGYCDKSVKLQIPYDYDEVEAFDGELAIVSFDGLYGAINKQNEMVIPFYYEKLEKMECGCFKIKKGNLYGLVDENNNMLIEPVYEQILPCNGPLIQLIKPNEMAWFDPFKSKIIWNSNSVGQ